MKAFIAFAVAILIVAVTPRHLAKAQNSKPIVVAVIDTGYTFNSAPINLCDQGHADVTTKFSFRRVPGDDNGHGTNIAHIISDRLIGHESKYCIVIIKYWDTEISAEAAVKNTAKAIRLATEMGVDFINYSSFGSLPNEEERLAVVEALEKGVKIVTAAGNNSKKIVQKTVTNDTESTNIFPAGYDPRIVVVGNLDTHGHQAPTSNYGDRVNYWEVGTNVYAGGHRMTGTSQATAVHTAKMVLEEINRRK